MGEVLPPVLLALLARPALSSYESELVSETLRLIAEFRQHADLLDPELAELNKASLAHPLVRRLSFWRMVVDFRHKFQCEPFRGIQVFDYYEVLRPDAGDFDWLLADIRERVNEKDRYLALNSAAACVGADWTKWWKIWLAVRDNGSLRIKLRGLIFVANCQWFWRFYFRVCNTFGQRWWWHRQYLGFRNKRNWLRSQWFLLMHLRRLASGEPFGWLAQLAMEAHKKQNQRWAPETWDELQKKRGYLITRAAKNGCKRAWRLFWPPLPHEEQSPNQTDYRIIAGLSGLQLAASEGLNFAVLSGEDAKRAARYGVNELNGFAPWLPNLAATRPNEVQEVLSECAKGEWKFEPERQNPHEVLNKLVWQGEYLDYFVRDIIWRLFETGDPPNKTIFNSAIRLLVRSHQEHRARLEQLAENRLHSMSFGAAFTNWMIVLLQVNANKALEILELKLIVEQNPSDVMVQICAVLGGDRLNESPALANPSYLEPLNLKRLIPLVYGYVRPADDIHHEGSYTPVLAMRRKCLEEV